jgi:hypothetical protein
VILTIQPEVLNGIMSNTTFRGRGLCGRFLYVVCNSKVGYRNVDPEPVPVPIKDNYYEFIRKILSGQDSGVLRLSSNANRHRLEYQQEVERRLGDKWASMRDWGGKLIGAMLRIAALFHAAELLERASETLISAENVTAAINVAECLSVHAEAAYQAMGANQSFADAKYLLKRIESTGQDELSKNELNQLTRGKFKLTEDMEPGLQILEQMGYIRFVRKRTGERGRPNEFVFVNPLMQKKTSNKH